eukprot:COSAG02_NODE_4623_length_5153_cov_3.148793_9_plen_42_part_00
MSQDESIWIRYLCTHGSTVIIYFLNEKMEPGRSTTPVLTLN